MLGWFVGRSLRRNALRDVDTAQNVMAPDARLAVARRVIAKMALVERQPGGANGAIDLQNMVLRQARRDKRAAGKLKARFPTPMNHRPSSPAARILPRLAVNQAFARYTCTCTESLQLADPRHLCYAGLWLSKPQQRLSWSNSPITAGP